jgi:hypothetical protein
MVLGLTIRFYRVLRLFPAVRGWLVPN